MTPRDVVADPGGLAARFGDHVRGEGLVEPGHRVVVAVSGGLDSVVLLHLFRFHPPVEDVVLTAAHLDHRMRPGSAADARWVTGLARAWNVGLRLAAAEPVPAREAEARSVRYAFLRRVAVREGADRVATAHHADDQAETVLFRAVRGTGVGGLRGIRERGPQGLIRPLLPFWREDLEAYAGAVGLRWRVDPTNRDTTRARNALRHRVLPMLEEDVAPGTRRALVRLARNARREDEAWQSLLPRLLEGVVREDAEDRVVVAREALLAYHSAVAARLVRALARRLGTVLDEAGTRAAMEFTTSGRSGGGVDLAGGLRLRRDFDRLIFLRREEGADPQPSRGSLIVPGSAPGHGHLTLGSRSYTVRWGPDVPGRWTAVFPVEELSFPLRLRGWHPGDRIHLPYGSKKLKKLFQEARIPAAERHGWPILVDARDQVLWVPGVVRSDRVAREAPGTFLTLGIDDVDEN